MKSNQLTPDPGPGCYLVVQRFFEHIEHGRFSDYREAKSLAGQLGGWRAGMVVRDRHSWPPESLLATLCEVCGKDGVELYF